MFKKTGKILLLLCLFILTACSAQTTPTAIPTPDLNPIRTEVAATVLAQIPQLCALTPTATQVPSATATETIAPTVASTATVATAQTTGTPSTNDLAMWVAQTVQDDTTFTPGQEFTMTWTIKNVGTSTWTAGYRLRFYSGNAFGAPKEIALGKEVKPGETVDITVDMKAPAVPAEYRSDWVLSNEELRNFKEPVFLKIKVAKAPTATAAPPTATVTKAPTETPTITSTP